MKTVKKLFFVILLFIFTLGIGTKTLAHNIDIDPDNAISLPYMILNGKASVSISDRVGSYTLHYQFVEIPSDIYAQMNTAQSEYDAYVEVAEKELDTLKQDLEEKQADYEEKVEQNPDSPETETARQAYQEAVDTYNAKVDELTAKTDEVNNTLKELTPSYVESNWILSSDDEVSCDLSTFTGSRTFVLWVRVTTSSETIYDEQTYTLNGTKEEESDGTIISLNISNLSLEVGETRKLRATITPEEIADEGVTWSTSNEEIATVSEDGTVTAIAEGNATITATTSDGEIATCRVEVVEEIPNINTGNNTQNNNQTVDEKDNTVAPGKIPQTGINNAIIVIAVVTLIVLAFVAYKKVNYYNFK